MIPTPITAERNGTMPITKRKPRRQTKPTTPARTTADRVKLYATVTMGVVIPLLSLGLSHTGGTLARTDHPVLAVFAFMLMLCVLAVSLSHLTWAIQDITRSPRWASWLLAVSFDMLLVLGELCHVAAESAGLATVVTAMMVTVATISMFLNVWAFLHHPSE